MKLFWLILILVSLAACQSMVFPTLESTPSSLPPSATPAHYELRQPSSADLLHLIDSILLAEEKIITEDDLLTTILNREPGSFQHLIGGDFERYYFDGFPESENLISRETLPWKMKFFGDLNSFSPILQIALLQYINSHQDRLEDNRPFPLSNVDVRTFPMDLNGDGNFEWLVGAEYDEYFLQNWLLLSKQADGLYHLLPGLAYDLTEVQEYSHDIEVHDLTGDGNSEIIKIHHYYLAGAIHGGIDVYTWKEGGLSLLKSMDLLSVPPVYGELYVSDYTIDDFDGNGLFEIRVSSPRFKRFDCQWTQVSTYYLDGRTPDVEISGESIPQTDECLIARALESEDTFEQIQLYQEAVRKFDPQAKPGDQLAWVSLQLAMGYAATGDDIRANLQLQNLINMQGEGKFLEFVQDKYVEANSPSPFVFCDVLYSSIPLGDVTSSLGSEIDIHLTHGAYPIDFAPLPNLVCPFPKVLGTRLKHVKIPVSASPVDALTAQGYPFTWSQSLNWDSDPEVEWLGVLSYEQPMLVLMNGDEKWNIDLVEISPSSEPGFEAATHPSEDGNGVKIFVLFSGERRYCDDPNTVKWLIAVSPDTMEHDNLYLCDSNQYSLATEGDIQHTVEEFSKPNEYELFVAPDWYSLPQTAENGQERRTILDLVRDTENEVIEQTNPAETAFQLSRLIVSLPEDDPAAQALLVRLYYLRGLNYELNGQEDLAVAAYLELIEASPQSLWSQYARLRIQPTPP